MNDRLEPDAPPRGAVGEQFRRLRHWLHSHSIRVRLYSVLVLLFLLVIGLGIIGFARLSDVNQASEVIRNHWLRDTRLEGVGSRFTVRLPLRTSEVSARMTSTRDVA